MAKVIYASLDELKNLPYGRASNRRISSKVVIAPDGSKVTVTTVDADSPTFSQDMTTAFRRNVARARRENRLLSDRAHVVDPGV